MSSWSNADNAVTVILVRHFMGLQRNYRQTMRLQRINRTNLFEDNTADEFISGMTVICLTIIFTLEFELDKGDVLSIGWNLKVIKDAGTRTTNSAMFGSINNS